MRQVASGSEVLAKARWEAFPIFKGRIDLLSSLAIGLLLLLGSLFYVWQHIQVVRLGYEIERLKAERAALAQREQELILEVAQLKSLKRVEEIARDRLGLTTPRPGQVVIIP